MKLDFIFSFCLAALLAAPAAAEVLLGEAQALDRVFPGCKPDRRVLYLTAEQVKAVEKAARSRLPSAVMTMFEAKQEGTVTARAYLDTDLVRTMPATVLVVVEPDGRLRTTLVLRFAEPTDYLPREGWLQTLSGRSLSDELWPGKGVRRVTGATLTVQALVAAVRRCLAIDALVVRTP